MIGRYLSHMKENKSTHERRAHAVQVAGLLTAGLFAVWLGTLGMRLTNHDAVAQSPETSLPAAAAAAAPQFAPHLEVSTTSIYSN